MLMDETTSFESPTCRLRAGMNSCDRCRRVPHRESMVRLLLVGCLTIATTTMIVAAQAPTFEVASVKPSPPDGSRGTGGGPVGGGRYVASSSTLAEIMQRAFDQYSRPGLIIGG